MSSAPARPTHARRLILRIAKFILPPVLLLLIGFGVMFALIITSASRATDASAVIDEPRQLEPGDGLAVNWVHTGAASDDTKLREVFDDTTIEAHHPHVRVSFDSGRYSTIGSVTAQKIARIENTGPNAVSLDLRISGPPGAEYSVGEDRGVGTVLAIIVVSTIFNIIMVLWFVFGSVYVLVVSIKEWSAAS